MILFATYHWKTLQTSISKITPKYWGIIAFTSIVGGFLANLMYFYILKKHNSAIVAALTYASPIFVLLISMLFLYEKTHPVAVAGILVSVIGIVMITYATHITHEGEQFQTYA